MILIYTLKKNGLFSYIATCRYQVSNKDRALHQLNKLCAAHSKINRIAVAVDRNNNIIASMATGNITIPSKKQIMKAVMYAYRR